MVSKYLFEYPIKRLPKRQKSPSVTSRGEPLTQSNHFAGEPDWQLASVCGFDGASMELQWSFSANLASSHTSTHAQLAEQMAT